MRFLLRWVVLFVTLALSGWLRAEGDWKAGVAKAVITPQETTWMAGYAARKGPFEEVLQDLHAKALVLEDQAGGRLVIVTLDLIGVPKPLRVDLEKLVAERYALPPESLLINASHTHCGPMIRLYRPTGEELRPSYANVPEDQFALRVRQTQAFNVLLRERVMKAIETAMDRLEPAVLTWHRARCGFSMNRRTPVTSGTFKNAPNPDGPVDQDVPVLQVKSAADDGLKAVLFGYACHATTLSVMAINGDWPGYAQHYFEQDHPGALAMFLNGCSGDQNPYPRRMHYYVERHGRSMATAIEAALETRALPVTGLLQCAMAWPEIPYSAHPTREELEARSRSSDRYEKRYAEFLLHELDARGSLPESYPVPVQTVRFGDGLTLVAMGGETTVDYALRLKRELGERLGMPIWVAGYSNDVMGYIPSERVLKEGGYEGATSMRYARSTIHPSPWAPGIEDRLVGAVYRLLSLDP